VCVRVCIGAMKYNPLHADTHNFAHTHTHMHTHAFTPPIHTASHTLTEKCCTDSRPDTRNSALKTLYSSLVAHGSVLGPSTCQTCLTDIVFPLLGKIMAYEVKDAPTNTPTHASDEKIRQHHSKDSAVKQWSETRGFAISGTCRLVRAYVPVGMCMCVSVFV
jgi:hypothetical protein